VEAQHGVFPRAILDTDELGKLALSLLNNFLPPKAYARYDSGMRQFEKLRAEDNANPLQATPSTIIRYTVRLGRLGTMSAASL
jgi:hypothetical protein